MTNDLADVHLAMQVMFVFWVLLVLRIIRATFARGSVGLPAALVLTMSFLYGGCFVYAVPGYTHLRPGGHWYLGKYDITEWLIVKATFASLLGLLGFAIGVGAFRKLASAQSARQIRGARMPRDYELAVLTVLGTFALVSYAGNYLRISFPMSAALFEAGRNLGVVVIGLGAWMAFRDGRSRRLWVVLAAMVPAYYVLLFGFASYGFLFGITLLSFWMAQISDWSRKPLLVRAAWSVGIIWLLLTGFVGWFSFRDEIRLVIWQNGSGNLLDVLVMAVSQTELFSLWNFQALDLVNIRLNLGLFIGRMIEQHALFPELQQWGATLVILPLVLVPRVLWPGKPARGGSDFMSEHTGLILSDSATFGSGTVFEFYINFGYVGVFVGFIAFGMILAWLDRTAFRHLREGRLMSFAKVYVIGIVALDPLLRPFFIVNGAVFAWIIMGMLDFALMRWLRGLRQRRAREDRADPLRKQVQ
ncbi:hypothetical protein KZZ07_24490 [Mameliella sp. CS4]|uniref:hypothetical protein n=1 Tax=Mameliella sp. CS4 TaxID=2862329 RepID=UPI001C5F0449|nr:hypothetical protein [Mameliella sp. CS4]MBW4985705.1 hypothetical protein [Mameliella sp. CS4]